MEVNHLIKTRPKDGVAFESAELILYGAVGCCSLSLLSSALAAEVDSIRQYLTGNPVMGLSSLIAAIIALELR